MNPADLELEAQIDLACKRGLAAESPEVARECFAIMAGLIANRSPERVAMMERERGLRV